MKIAYLDQNRDRFDSYMLGSSRLGTTDPASLDRLAPGARFYNLFVSSGTPNDDFLILSHLVQQNYSIRNIYLHIDMDILLENYAFPETDLRNQHHPLVTGMHPLNFYAKYLVALPTTNLIGKIKQNLAGTNYVYLDTRKTGMWSREDVEKRMATDPAGHVAGEATLQMPFQREIHARYLEQNLQCVRAILALCQEQSIPLYVYLAPNNHRVLAAYDPDDYARALRALAGITSFWSFCDYNSVTTDDRHFYEVSHYSRTVGDWIAARVMRGDDAEVPRDFGHFVTNENVEAYLERVRGERRSNTLHQAWRRPT